MDNNKDKPSKQEADYTSACNEIRLVTDPAAKVLSSLILDGYSQEEQFIHHFPDAALIELVPGSAEAVITNTAELLNRVDCRIRFAFSDFCMENEGCYEDKVLKIVNNIHDASECDPMTIHVLRNANDCLRSKDTIRMFQDMFMYDQPKEFHFIYVFDEKNYYLFCDKYNFAAHAHPLWLHRLPGEMDINQKAQAYSLERMNKVTVNKDIFTQSGKALINRAKRQADLFEENEIDYVSLLLAAADGVESSVALEQCLNLTPERLQWLREDATGVWKSSRNEGIHFLDSSAERIVRKAIKMASADGYPDPEHPGLVSAFHLIGALSMNECITKDLGRNREFSFKQAVNKIADWYYQKKVSSSISDNRKALSEIGFKHSQYRKMIGNVFGQQEALTAIHEAFCLAELKKHGSDKYSGLFAFLLFIGPKNVGKGHLARLIAETNDLPFQYFNLSFYTEKESLPLEPQIKNCFQSLLVFENIAEAQPAVINQICRLIESGKLKDHNSGEEIDFTNSIVIVIASSDQDWELVQGQYISNKLAIRQGTVLSSLHNIYITDTGLPLIPPQLLILLEKHQVVLFNRLQSKDLLNICARKLVKFGTVVEKNGSKRLTYDPLIPFSILCSEGGKPTPTAINNAVEMLISAEIRKFTSGFPEDSFLYLLSSYDRLHFTIDNEQEMNPEVSGLFRTSNKPNIILLTGRETAERYCSNIPQVNWYPVSSLEELELALDSGCFDFAILDLWFNVRDAEVKKEIIREFITGLDWDNMNLPFSAIALELFGERYLQVISRLFEQLPVVILNKIDGVWADCVQEFWKRPSSYYIDTAEELGRMRDKYPIEFPAYIGIFRYDLFLEFLESNCLRGMINTAVIGESAAGPEEDWHNLFSCLDGIHQRLHRERMAEEIFKQRKVLSFKPQWELSGDDNLVTVRLRDLELE